MITLGSLLALGGGAYWASSQSQRRGGERSPSDETTAQKACRPSTSVTVPTWTWILAATLPMVAVLVAVGGPGLLGGPGALVGPGVLGP